MRINDTHGRTREQIKNDHVICPDCGAMHDIMESHTCWE